MREAARQIDEFLHRYGFASKATIEAEIDKLNDEEERVRAMAALITPLGVDAESYFALDGPAFSAAAVAVALPHFAEAPALWLASGGGRRNATLMSMIAGRVGMPVRPAEAFDFDGDSVEAEAWAFLAVRSRLGLPITFPGTTGVAAPLTGGVVAGEA